MSSDVELLEACYNVLQEELEVYKTLYEQQKLINRQKQRIKRLQELNRKSNKRYFDLRQEMFDTFVMYDELEQKYQKLQRKHNKAAIIIAKLKTRNDELEVIKELYEIRDAFNEVFDCFQENDGCGFE